MEFIESSQYTEVITHKYIIRVYTDAARADVILAGEAIAGLDMRSAVNTWDGENEIADREPDPPVYTGVSRGGEGYVFTWTGKSSLWTKKYTLVCTPLRFRYELTLEGVGNVDSVNYFSGNLADKTGGSSYQFSEGYNPCRSEFENENHTFRSLLNNHRWAVLMVPHMHCYVFRTEGITQRLALGLVADKGEHNFTAFDYHSSRRAGTSSIFYLTTDQGGHQKVNGSWKAPCIIGYGADDEHSALTDYSDYYFSSGIAEIKPVKQPPRFWRGPIFCGWLEQYMQGMIGNRALCDSCEGLYDAAAAKLKKYGMKPSIMIIDDKWQKHYATDEPDPNKWKDLRAFADRRHAEGIHTMLWFKLWDPEGWDGSLCVTADNGEVSIDPSTPQFKAELDKIIYRLLSSDEGCYDCDGFKLDYAFMMPIGRKVKSYSGKYGFELLYEYMEYIYKRAKEVKPDAVINCSPCHPYFAHLCDQARLHDYDCGNRDCLEDMSDRGRLFAIANPNTLLDTDNSGFNTRRDTMRWQLNQDHTGVPDIYTMTSGYGMTEDDFYDVAAMWDEYNRRVDGEYTQK